MKDDGKTRRIKWSVPHDLPDNPINMARIARIESTGGFSHRSAGTPEVCLNDAGAFPDLPADALVFVDGHHRRFIAVRAGLGDETHIMRIHEGLSREAAEKLFLELNDYREHRANELFVHRVRAGEPRAARVNEIVENAGFRIPAHSAPVKFGITASGSVEWVYGGAPGAKWGPVPKTNGTPKDFPTALTATLLSIREMYETDLNVTKGNLIKGVGAFYLRYGKKIDPERLHANLPGKHSSVKRLFQAAETQRDAMGWGVPESIGRVIRGVYNGPKGGGKAALPEWA